MAEAKTPKIPEPELIERVQTALNTDCYRLSRHAIERADERCVQKHSIKHVLRTGFRNKARDGYRYEHRSWAYCFEGRDVDCSELRVIVTFKETPGDEHLLVITVVRLGTTNERWEI